MTRAADSSSQALRTAVADFLAVQDDILENFYEEEDIARLPKSWADAYARLREALLSEGDGGPK